MSETKVLPNARKTNIVVQHLEKDLLIYDIDAGKAFCLNETARLIFEHCDGKNTLPQAAKKIGKKLKSPVDEQVFQMALYQLQRSNLLDNDSSATAVPRVSRRDLMRSGLALSVALPMVSTLVVPSSAHAQSAGGCVNPQGTCTASQSCCSMVCSGTMCCVSLPIDGGGTCSVTADCCNNNVICQNSMCCGPPTGFCAQPQDCCVFEAACVGNVCCNPSQLPCSSSAECCSGLVCSDGTCGPPPV